MNVQQTVQNALNTLITQVRQADAEYLYDNIEFSGSLPVAELVQSGYMVQVLENEDADVLSHLLVQNDQGEVEIERCPFAPLALMSHDDKWSGTEVADILHRADITTFTMDDLENIPEWYGTSVVSWLFPQRLSEALSLLEMLREHREAQ